MLKTEKTVNLVMSGGGVKGIAYAGVFEIADRLGYKWGNIAGVSAGAMAGALRAAGYNGRAVGNAIGGFDFKGIQLVDNPEKLAVVRRFLDYSKTSGHGSAVSAAEFLSTDRGDFLQDVLTYTKEGCLFDGDYLEDWVADMLAKKGIRNFGDLRGGIVDSLNPGGYKLRVTGVDLNRAKMVVLPDDAVYYGIAPDNFEVAKAVRISTCVPFAFKPVEIKKWTGNEAKTYNLVDGGVFDRFPSWLIDTALTPTVGFRLSGGETYNFFSADTPLIALKALISAVHDIGIPKNTGNTVKYVGEIDTTKVGYLDFNLEKAEREYMLNAGRKTAIELFASYEAGQKSNMRFTPWFYRRFRGPYL